MGMNEAVALAAHDPPLPAAINAASFCLGSLQDASDPASNSASSFVLSLLDQLFLCGLVLPVSAGLRECYFQHFTRGGQA